MGSVLERQFWVVNVLFLATAMALVARTGGAIAESNLFAMPATAPAHSPSRAVTQPLAALNAEWLSKLTGLPLPKQLPIDTPVSDVKRSAAPVRTALRLKLLGTLVAATAEYSVASIQDIGSLRAQTYGIGDTIQTAEVVEIERARVIILRNNRYEFIDGMPGESTPAVESEPRATADRAPASLALGKTITRTSDSEFRVPREELVRIFSNLNELAMQARIVPSFKDGVAQGFKLFSIRPDSLYKKIGMQDGDVIRRINGYDLDSVEKGMELYLKLKQAGRIDLEVERSGRVMRSTYNVVSEFR